MEDEKEKIILDIQNLLNSYNSTITYIDPVLLSFMDKDTLKNILKDLLIQKEKMDTTPDIEWLSGLVD